MAFSLLCTLYVYDHNCSLCIVLCMYNTIHIVRIMRGYNRIVFLGQARPAFCRPCLWAEEYFFFFFFFRYRRGRGGEVRTRNVFAFPPHIHVSSLHTLPLCRQHSTHNFYLFIFFFSTQHHPPRSLGWYFLLDDLSPI